MGDRITGAEPAETDEMSEHAISNAKGWLESIVELTGNLALAEEGDEIECGQCEGTGETQSASNGEDEECPVCNGSGMIENPHKADDIRQEIEQSALSVQVRSGWYSPGDSEGVSPEEFEILLSTGGPALRIIGDLDGYGQPSNPRLQWQDWGTPWTDHDTTSEEDEALEAFCGCYYFGEG